MTTISNLPLAEMAALTAAALWALTGLITQPIVHHFGATATNRYRSTMAGATLIVITTLFGLWHTLSLSSMWLLVLSGFIGIFIGDTALMQALKRCLLYTSPSPRDS